MAQIVLHLDFETASRINLKKRGLDNYLKDPSTHALMLAWGINDALPQMWFPHAGPMPEQLELMIRRNEILKSAFHAEFERGILREVLGIDTPATAWDDPLNNARYASIGGPLEYVGKVLGLGEDKAKLATGNKLKKLFCEPNKKGEFNTWLTHPVEWAEFVEYCKRDVIAEREVGRKLRAFSLPKFEEKVLELTVEMNEVGVPIDRPFLSGASKIVETEQERFGAEMRALTGIENPNSQPQVLAYLKTQGYPYGSIGKKFLARAKKDTAITKEGQRCIELREVLAKSSTSKLESLKNFISPDGYIRHTFSYYGADSTGRWSARGPQFQNFIRGGMKRYDEALEAIRQYQSSEDMAKIREFGNPLDVVAACMRSAIRAPEGSRFLVSDLSNIDSRTLAWWSGCRPMLEAYRQGIDLYTTYGVQFFGMSYDELRYDKVRRPISKVCVLSCGYGLGGGEEKVNRHGDTVLTGLWKVADDNNIDLSQEDSHRAVRLFREMYHEIPNLWRRVENAVVLAIRTGENQQVGLVTIGCIKPNRLLWIQLPSGRKLFFIRPQIETEEAYDGSLRTKITYEADIGASTTRGRVKTYGGAIVGIVTQAMARDIFAYGLLEARKEGFKFGALIHDEGVACTADRRLTHELLAECMTRKPPYADDDLILAAESGETIAYRKL